jgi:DNA repair photolyase
MAAPPQTRLNQIRRLTESHIATSVRLDPIIPGVTDDNETFTRICESVSAIGVKMIAASVLFLRPAIKESLRRNISDPVMWQRIMNRFSNAKRLAIHAERSSVTAIPCEERESIYRRLYVIAEKYGLGLHTCGCKNPDIATGEFSRDCRLSGKWSPQEREARELW